MNLQDYQDMQLAIRRHRRKMKKITEQEALRFLLDEDETDLDNDVEESTIDEFVDKHKWIGW